MTNKLNLPSNIQAAIEDELKTFTFEGVPPEFRPIYLQQRLAGGQEVTVYVPDLNQVRVYRVFSTDSRVGNDNKVAVPLTFVDLSQDLTGYKGYIEAGRYDMDHLTATIQAIVAAEDTGADTYTLIYLQPTPVGAQALIYLDTDSGGRVYVIGLVQNAKGLYRPTKLADYRLDG